MRLHTTLLLAVILFSFSNTRAGEVFAVSGEDIKFPKAPFDLAIPKEQLKTIEETDLTSLEGWNLKSWGRNEANNKNYKLAAQCLYWAYRKNAAGAQYDLACYYSMLGDIDSAVFMLQKSAVDQGAEFEWLQKDTDLENVRKSKYWLELKPFLKECAQSWKNSDYQNITINLPTNLKNADFLIIGLHGYQSSPADFAIGEGYEKVSVNNSVVFSGISATIPVGESSFYWSEDHDKDYKRITAGIEFIKSTLKSEITLKNKKIILIGFSQGAQLAIELAARHPDQFAGAIALCPGVLTVAQLNKIKTDTDLKSQTYIILNGAEEAPSNINLAKEDVTYLKNKGAKVIYHKYEGMGHSFPDLYYEQLSQWIQFININHE